MTIRLKEFQLDTVHRPLYNGPPNKRSKNTSWYKNAAAIFRADIIEYDQIVLLIIQFDENRNI